MGGFVIPLGLDTATTETARMLYQSDHGIDTRPLESWLVKRLAGNPVLETGCTYPHLLRGNHGVYHACAVLTAQDRWKLLCFPSQAHVQDSFTARLRGGVLRQLHHRLLDSLNTVTLYAEWLGSGKLAYKGTEALAAIRDAAGSAVEQLQQMGSMPLGGAEDEPTKDSAEPFLLGASLKALATNVNHTLDQLPGDVWLFLPKPSFQSLLDALLKASGAEAVIWQWELESGLSAELEGISVAWLQDADALLAQGRLEAYHSRADHTPTLIALWQLAEHGLSLEIEPQSSRCRLHIPSRHVMAVPHAAPAMQPLAASV